MIKDEIIRMAQEAGICKDENDLNWAAHSYELETFAALVASKNDLEWHKIVHAVCEESVLAEREACAKVCDDMSNSDWSTKQCAEFIRARGQA